jgi:hypothetical protein
MKFFFFWLLFFPLSSWASDSTIVELDSTKKHSIKKAVIWSSVIPGAGQVYNHIAMPKGQKKAYWKVPLIYAGLGATGYFLVTNQITQKELKNEYNFRQENGFPNLALYEDYDDQGVLTLYNQYLDWRDLSILGIVAVYFIQIVDAGVEAHFVSFDVSEDLSINVEPTIMAYRTPGMRLTFNFN